MVKRKRWTVAEREAIYKKMDGRCAYCGQEITMREMQVDHVIPLRRYESDTLGQVDRPEPDSVDNLLPACRSCNRYKSTMSVEIFRSMLGRALDLYAKGLTDAQIANELSVKTTSISSWRSRRGLQRNLPPLQHGTRPDVTVDIPPDVFPCNAPRENTQKIPAGGVAALLLRRSLKLRSPQWRGFQIAISLLAQWSLASPFRGPP